MSVLEAEEHALTIVRVLSVNDQYQRSAQHSVSHVRRKRNHASVLPESR